MQYRSYVQQLSIANVLILISIVGACCLLGWAVAEPPLSELPPQNPPPTQTPAPETQDGSADVPGAQLGFPQSRNDYTSDPLFLEIQKRVLESMQRPSYGSSYNQGDSNQANSNRGDYNRVDPLESIGPARWHAAESILAAARALEEEVHQAVANKDFGAAASTEETIKTLRSQARELLRIK